MSKLSLLIVALVLVAANAFVAPSVQRSPAFVGSIKSTMPSLHMAEDTYWEGEYPPSSVLGPVMSKMPSAVLGCLSLVFLALCGISCYQSSLLLQEPSAVATGAWVKWYYVLGSFGGPFAWGTHVACWIQRKNGM